MHQIIGLYDLIHLISMQYLWKLNELPLIIKPLADIRSTKCRKRISADGASRLLHRLYLKYDLLNGRVIVESFEGKKTPHVRPFTGVDISGKNFQLFRGTTIVYSSFRATRSCSNPMVKE
jgi:hypothetical protein